MANATRLLIRRIQQLSQTSNIFLSLNMDGDIPVTKQLEKQMNQQLADIERVKEMLKIQLSEFEMLESMFSNPGEICIDDPSVVAHIRNYINGTTCFVPNRLDFSVHILVGDNKLQMCVNLPLEYPDLEPDVFVRSNGLSRMQQGSLNCDLGSYISSLDRGDICIGAAIAWLQENAFQYFNKSCTPDKEEKSMSNSVTKNMFTRFWIYSHHIYSKVKRRVILDLADAYNLTGFCLPGRPGIICIEGLSPDCQDWWMKVKSMNWKKIMLKKIEEEEEFLDGNAGGFRKFPNFTEISFESKGKGKDFHMDFGEFLKYLSAHGCEYMFKEYFGIEGNKS